MSHLPDLTESLGQPEPGPTRDIDGDILDELSFHLDMRTQEFVEAGMEPRAARAHAEERFGDVRLVQQQCRKIQLGERIMLQRIQTILIFALIAAVAVIGYESFTMRRETSAAMRDLSEGIDQLSVALAASRGPSSPDGLPDSGVVMIGSEPVQYDARQALTPGAEELEAPTLEPDQWLARFKERDDDWRHGLKLAYEIAELPGEEAVQLMTELWPDLSLPQREQAMKPWVFGGGKPEALRILDLAANDADLSVQNRAFIYLEDYAYQDFSEDFEAYRAWAERFAGAPLGEVLETNAQDFVGRLRGMQGEDLARELAQFDRLDLRPGEGAGIDLAAVFADAGALDLLDGWLGGTDADVVKTALAWSVDLEPDEPWMREHVLPFLERPEDAPHGVVSAACRSLGQPGNDWAREPLGAVLESRALIGLPGAPLDDAASGAVRALAEIGNPRDIPRMIGLIAANPDYATVYGIGYFGLGKLTGVTYDESHDGTWWLEWWEKNRGRMPAEISALDVPTFAK